MKHLEEIADTLGFDLKIKDGGLIHGSGRRTIRLAPGLEVVVKPTIVSSYHDASGEIAILVGHLIGDLGFMIYNSSVNALVCTDMVFFDKSKLGFAIDNVFENEPDSSPDAIALRFEIGLVCQVRRIAGEKTFALIDDRRATTKGQAGAEILGSGGPAPDHENLGREPTELPA